MSDRSKTIEIFVCWRYWNPWKKFLYYFCNPVHWKEGFGKSYLQC